MFTNISRKEKLYSLDLSEGEREELEGLLKGKTSYPYEAASWGLMDAHPSQVTKAMFYSELTDSHISDKDYLAYLRLCELMRWETFAEAHDFYLYNDVLMLTDVITTHIKFAFEIFGLAPTHYIGAPAFGIDACLRTCMYPVELARDKETFKDMEGAKRGGYSHAIGRATCRERVCQKV